MEVSQAIQELRSAKGIVAETFNKEPSKVERAALLRLHEQVSSLQKTVSMYYFEKVDSDTARQISSLVDMIRGAYGVPDRSGSPASFVSD